MRRAIAATAALIRHRRTHRRRTRPRTQAARERARQRRHQQADQGRHRQRHHEARTGAAVRSPTRTTALARPACPDTRHRPTTSHASAQNAGYDVHRQKFTFPFFRRLTPPTLTQLTPDEKELETDIFEYSGSGDVTGSVVPTNDLVIPATPEPSSTSGCEASDFEPAPAEPVDRAHPARGLCTSRSRPTTPRQRATTPSSSSTRATPAAPTCPSARWAARTTSRSSACPTTTPSRSSKTSRPAGPPPTSPPRSRST